MSTKRGHPKFLVVGEILRPHGLRGEVRMRLLTDNPACLPQLDSVYLGDAPGAAALDRLALKAVRFNKEYALLTFEGVDSRNDAELLRDKKVMIGIDQALPLETGEYFLFELIGMLVVADQIEVGRVKEVLQTGANDVYIIEGERYGEILIPAHEETIVNIDFEADVITMSLPEGLLPTE